MDFKIGGKYALVGESGSGKTTLLRLLLGQLQANKGAVLFDQMDASIYDPKTFSDQMAYIEQNVFLFKAFVYCLLNQFSICYIDRFAIRLHRLSF